MFAYIKGILVNCSPAQAVVDVQGIGYSLFIPCSALGQLPQIGDSVHFHTSFVVRELSQALYGFLTTQERDIFEGLLNVSGVGPKLALSLIGHLPPSNLQTAISQSDLITLCKVPGVGKKTAERLVIELRDKMTNWALMSPSDLAIAVHKDPHLQRTQDAMLALINLGYNQSTAQKALKQSLKELSEDCELSQLITYALQNIHKA
jgi:Holliday junction DNA helicase RuvA